MKACRRNIFPIIALHKSDSKENPLSATATLKFNNMSGGEVAKLNPPGFVSGGCPHHHQRGHLIGNTLGGKNEMENLVTLTDGSNHPAMFAVERIVKKYVLAHKATTFTYTVEVCYSNYSLGPEGYSGALGNRYCNDPCPSHLLIGLVDDTSGFEVFSNSQVFDDYDDPGLSVAFFKHHMDGNKIKIMNGMYKQHSTLHVHTTNCPGLVSTTIAQITCSSCGLNGGSVSKDPGWSDFFGNWHKCDPCQTIWCGDHGRQLDRPGGFAYLSSARICPNCKQVTKLFQVN
ncbi:DNA/RNA non-specific endonuclease [Xanthomonas campestris]|uniref:DNA/RNA non-specific endonuclease n=1 Tax=Xanthomonas campestris TaxID=339 RepID=UPI001E5523CB|nr:DNA/RNA non-specific endonuclease [Xanthomonas campestris]MCC5072294.1 DNA/RNA non-specific endonuclease [Xanthomonas campestris pv. plantaginis]